MDTSTNLRWKELDDRLEAARRARDIPEMQRVLGLMTEFMHRTFGRRREPEMSPVARA